MATPLHFFDQCLRVNPTTTYGKKLVEIISAVNLARSTQEPSAYALKQSSALTFLANVIHAADSGMALDFSRSKQTMPEKYISLSHIFEKYGYIKYTAGVHYGDNIRCGQVVPTEKLTAVLGGIVTRKGVSSIAELPPPSTLWHHSPVVKSWTETGKDGKTYTHTYKVSKKTDITSSVPKTESVLIRDGILANVNSDYSKHIFSDGSGVEFTPVLQSKYSETWEQGGRMYCVRYGNSRNYQLFSGVEREQITIDGEATVELDVKALHPHLSAAMNGIQLPPNEDIYSLLGEEYRPLTKLLTIIAFNTASQSQAVMAVSEHVASLIHRKNMEDEDLGVVLSEKDIKQLNAVVDVVTKNRGIKLREFYNKFYSAVKEKYPAIYALMFTANGLRLQYMDSTIMADALLALHDNGIVALPVHDSLICKKSDAPAVRKAYMDSYRSNTQKYDPSGRGFEVELRVEKTDSAELEKVIQNGRIVTRHILPVCRWGQKTEAHEHAENKQFVPQVVSVVEYIERSY